MVLAAIGREKMSYCLFRYLGTIRHPRPPYPTPRRHPLRKIYMIFAFLTAQILGLRDMLFNCNILRSNAGLHFNVPKDLFV